MPVVVDNQPLSTDSLGLRTFGQVLAHLQRENRLIVHVLIDGQEPDLDAMPALKATPTGAHTIYVETTEPRTMARQVLDETDRLIDQADELRGEAVDLLSAGQQNKAFEKLSTAFGYWQHTQDSISKVAQLLRVDLNRLVVDSRSLAEFLGEFAGQLRGIRSSLEGRDFVSLADTLAYELPETTARWRDAIAAIRDVVGREG